MDRMTCDVCDQEVSKGEDATWLDGIRTGENLSVLVNHAGHIKCSPSRAQYIIAPEFGLPVVDERPEYDKRLRDPSEVEELEREFTNAWYELQENIKEAQWCSVVSKITGCLR